MAGLIMLCWLLDPCAGAEAQRDGSRGRGGDEEGSLFDRWNFHPKYSTTYDVNRTRRTWSQRLSINRKFGWFSVKETAQLKKMRNSAQNNYREQRASNKLAIDSRFSNWTLGLDFQLGRDSSENIFSIREDGDTSLDLRLERSVDLPGLTPIRMTATGGYAAESNINQRNPIGQQPAQRDSSVAEGLAWSLSGSTSGPLSENLSYNARAGVSGADQSSETYRFEGGILDQKLLDDQTDSRGDVSLTVKWEPDSTMTGELKTDLRRAQYENYDFEERQTETKKSQMHNIEAKFEGDVHPRLNVQARGRQWFQELDYQVKDRDNLKRTLEYQISLRYKPTVPLLRGALLRPEWETSSTRNERQGSLPFDARNRSARLSLDRPLVGSLRLVATGQIELRQDFYDDGSLDRDEVLTTLDGTLNYSVGRRFDARLSYQRRDSEIINIRAEKATGNNVVQRHRISANYTYMLTKRLTVEQQFNIFADYTFFTFDEGSNTLRRTNEVKTIITPEIGDNTTLNVEHLYRRGDSGGYQRTGQTGSYTYRPSTETLRQYLLLEAQYRIYNVVTFGAKQSFDDNSRRSLVNGTTTGTQRVEFSGLVSVEHEFSPGFTVEGRFRKTASNQEDDYWFINASLSRDF
ncbi:MAG: hypothetical protein GF355_02300 [Candidatus Eisenbacteria bacterium]|nr:hypothetical protein [Candidatus Eisenbacteria bacterium]